MAWHSARDVLPKTASRSREADADAMVVSRVLDLARGESEPGELAAAEKLSNISKHYGPLSGGGARVRESAVGCPRLGEACQRVAVALRVVPGAAARDARVEHTLDGFSGAGGTLSDGAEARAPARAICAGGATLDRRGGGGVAPAVAPRGAAHAAGSSFLPGGAGGPLCGGAALFAYVEGAGPQAARVQQRLSPFRARRHAAFALARGASAASAHMAGLTVALPQWQSPG